MVPNLNKITEPENWVSSSVLLKDVEKSSLSARYPIKNASDFTETLEETENNFIYTITHKSGKQKQQYFSYTNTKGEIIRGEGYILFQIKSKDDKIGYIWYHKTQLDTFSSFNKEFK